MQQVVRRSVRVCMIYSITKTVHCQKFKTREEHHHQEQQSSKREQQQREERGGAKMQKS